MPVLEPYHIPQRGPGPSVFLLKCEAPILSPDRRMGRTLHLGVRILELEFELCPLLDGRPKGSPISC